MTYTVREIFYTLQGEGANTGRPAVFCRFAGCNLWTGREADRSTAICQFCDTEFVGVGPDGGSFVSPDALVSAVVSHWPSADRMILRLTVQTVEIGGRDVPFHVTAKPPPGVHLPSGGGLQSRGVPIGDLPQVRQEGSLDVPRVGKRFVLRDGSETQWVTVGLP